MLAENRNELIEPELAGHECPRLRCERRFIASCEREQHVDLELNFVSSGSISYLVGGQKVKVRAGELSIFWGAKPIRIVDYSQDTVHFIAIIPLKHFLNWQLPEDFVDALMHGQVLRDRSEDAAKSNLLFFERWEKDLSSNSFEWSLPILLEMQARLTRVAMSSKTLQSVPSPRSNLSKLEMMAEYISGHYTQKITVQQIGDYVNLHPNYAMNLFQKSLGTTLINFITEYRVAHAQRLLVMTKQSITDIAFQSGFLSISRFNDAFCRACGCSPRAYRKENERTA